MQTTYSKAKIKVPANFHLQDTQRNQEMSRPPFKFCIMLKLRNLNVLSVHRMKNRYFEVKICNDPIMQHICFICGATNVACGCRGEGGGVKLVGELIHVQ